MTTRLPVDAYGYSIEVFRLKDGGAITLAANTAASTLSARLSNSVDIISVMSTVNTYIATGNSATVASSSTHYLREHERVFLSLGRVSTGGQDSDERHGYLAVRSVTANGNVYISQLD